MSIGERIISLREENGISQYQLANLMGVSRQAVSKWENDQNSPDTVKLIQLADVLSTDVEYLATGKPAAKAPSPAIITVEKVVDRVVEVEKIVEKPVIVEKRVEVEKIVEVPVVKKFIRYKFVRNPHEILLAGLIGFILGLLIGMIF